MNFKRVVVIAPGGAETGGVELLHQLVNATNALGIDSFVAYHPLGRRFSIPEAYNAYRVDVLQDMTLVNDPGTCLVVPEVLSYLIGRFKKPKRLLWWLSVDNYLNSRSLRYALANRFTPYTYYDVNKPRDTVRHLCQSQYAALYLAERGINDVAMLSDFINDEYLEEGRALDICDKENLLAYNPTKGVAQTLKLLPHLGSKCKVVALKGLTRRAVVQILRKAKVYIDFGNHPGKDRFPREAAALGCCIVTNRRGSAANENDVAIDPMYKIDDRLPDFVAPAVQLINGIFQAFPAHHERFENYRQIIAEEKTMFGREVRNIFGKYV